MSMRKSQVTLYVDTQGLELDDLGKLENVPVIIGNLANMPLVTLLAGGIVNPMGPTLTAICAVGELEPGAEMPLVYLMLNPFNQYCVLLGELVVGDDWNAMKAKDVIEQLLDIPFGGCPTFFLPSEHLERKDAIVTHALWLKRFPDAERSLERMLSNPMSGLARIKRDFRLMTALTRKLFEDPDYNPPDPEPLDGDDYVKMSAIMLSDPYLAGELRGFCVVWDGSIRESVRSGASQYVPASMSGEEMGWIMGAVVRHCNCPPLLDLKANPVW